MFIEACFNAKQHPTRPPADIQHGLNCSGTYGQEIETITYALGWNNRPWHRESLQNEIILDATLGLGKRVRGSERTREKSIRTTRPH